MVYIASDHGGYELKTKILKYLTSKNIEVKDMGPYEYHDGDDYPDTTLSAIKGVQNHHDAKGILICRNGAGVSMFANKFKGIRSTISWNPAHAKSAKNDDDTNILALPADFLDENSAYQIVDVWLETAFSNDARHKRRLKKVTAHDNPRNI